MYHKNKKVKHLFSKITLTVVVVTLLVVGVVAWRTFANNKSANTIETATETTNDESINYSPPTDEEKQSAEEHKKSIAEQLQSTTQTNSNNQSSTKKQVVVDITSWGTEGSNFEVSAFVSDIIEDGGTCKLTLTQGAKTVTASSKGSADAKKTICIVKIAKSKLSSGMWSGIMSYSSTKAQGTSDKVSDIKI